MERMTLEAEIRPAVTKGGRNQLRQEDKVLAVLYGRGKETYPLIVEGKPLYQLFASGGSNVLVDLKVKEKGKKAKQETVMFKDIQRDIIKKDKILHVDFIRISMTDKIEVDIQLNFIGEPAGAKEGGVLQQILREVAVKCLPSDIPESFDVDLSDLNIGDSITVGSLKFPDGVELLTPADEPLVQILAPVIEEEPTEEVEEGAEEVTEETPAAEEESS